MGVFDDSSEDDNDDDNNHPTNHDQRQRQMAARAAALMNGGGSSSHGGGGGDDDDMSCMLAAATTTTTTTCSNNPKISNSTITVSTKETQEDDEDPLDAFMKSMERENQQRQQQQHVTTNRFETKHSGRLDIENEEEATSHWQVGAAAAAAAEPRYDQQHPQENDWHAEWDADNGRGKNTASGRNTTTRYARSAESNHTHNEAGEAGAAMVEINVKKDFWKGTNTAAGQAWREQHKVTCTSVFKNNYYSTSAGITQLDPILEFSQLQDIFGPNMMQSIAAAGYVQPTVVQSQTLAMALAGHDVLVTAATGQGKTMAYLWPLAVHVQHQEPPLIPNEDTGPMAIVLVPTRELALQIHQQAMPLLYKTLGLTVKAIIGGQGKWMLTQELKKAGPVHVVIATPGRLTDVLNDHPKRGGLSLSRVSCIVLDEADKMLHMGFQADVTAILSQCCRPTQRRNCQMLFLSATMGRSVEALARTWLLPTAIRIAVGQLSGQSSEHVQQHAIVVPDTNAKLAWLLEMLPVLQQVGRILIFVSSREGCETLANTVKLHFLKHDGDDDYTTAWTIHTLHGEKHQSDRNAALQAFRRGGTTDNSNNKYPVLIATDVAARGLDVPAVATVINYDPAKSWDIHVHRIGRAGRLAVSATPKKHKKNSTDDNDDDDHDNEDELEQQQEQQQQQGTAYTLLTHDQSYFAAVMKNALEREGRQVDPELVALASQDKGFRTNKRYNSHSNSNPGLQHHDGGGLKGGFKNDGNSNKVAGYASHVETNYYGPSASSTIQNNSSDNNNNSNGGSPQKRKKKKSRWS